MPQTRDCATAGAGTAAAIRTASAGNDKDVKIALGFIALDPPT
jgi:hypothetical protein